MEEIGKVLGRFATRDIPFIVGGVSVIFSFLWLVDIPIPINPSISIVIFTAGIGYVIGYAIQDGLRLISLVNASVEIKSNKFLRFCYARWMQRPWMVDSEFDAVAEYFRMYQELNTESLAPIDRIISLKQVGNAVGGSWLVCCFLLLAKSLAVPSRISWALCLATGAFSLLLILLGWLQAMHLNEILFQRNKHKLTCLVDSKSRHSESSGPHKNPNVPD